MSDTYDGWASRETWALVLHLDNDQGLYEGALEAAGALKPDHECDGCRDGHERAIGEAIKEYAATLLTVDGYIQEFGGDHLPAALARVAEDIGSLYRVDWDEVGAHYLQTLSES